MAAAHSILPSDRPRAERAVSDLYREFGEPPPIFVWLNSPLAGAVAANIFAERLARSSLGTDVLDVQLRAQLLALGDDVRTAEFGRRLMGDLEDQLPEQLPAQSGTRPEAALGGPLAHQLGELLDSLERQLPERFLACTSFGRTGAAGEFLLGSPSVASHVKRGLSDEFDEFVESQVRDDVEGILTVLRQQSHGTGEPTEPGSVRQHWWSWAPGAGDVGPLVMARGFGVSYDRRSARQLARYDMYLRSAGWMWPMRGAAILTERPVRVERDQNRRLHSETGPAVLYGDGWGVFAHHGVRVPERVVTGEVSLQDVLSERDAEQRAVMVECFGPERFVSAMGAALAHEDGCGRLWRAPQENGEEVVMFEVFVASADADDTKKSYWLRVPPHIHAAGAALAWTFPVQDDDVFSASDLTEVRGKASSSFKRMVHGPGFSFEETVPAREYGVQARWSRKP